MTTYEEYLKSSSKYSSKSSSGSIIADTRPGRAHIYLDGEQVMDVSGQIAMTPTVIHNVSKGIHTITFSKSGYVDITIIANVLEGSDCHARAVLNTKMWYSPGMSLAMKIHWRKTWW